MCLLLCQEPESPRPSTLFPGSLFLLPFSSTPSPGRTQVLWRSGVFVYFILLGKCSFPSSSLFLSLASLQVLFLSFLVRPFCLIKTKYLLLLLKIRAFFDSLGVRQLGFLSEKGLVRLCSCGRRKLSGVCGASAYAQRKGCRGGKQVPSLLWLASRLLPPLT